MIVTERSHLVKYLTDPDVVWDLVIVGGGATGLGTALDAASRGYKTLLLEQFDFAKGTSSRSTKLVHGGVRYLAQGDIGLVREALFERGLLGKNAAHLVKNERFIIPYYSWWEGLFYLSGLSIYDLLAGKLSLGKSRKLPKKSVMERLPFLKDEKLRGGILYHDGQFDDSRLAVNIAQTTLEQGGLVLNHFKVCKLLKSGAQRIDGVCARDEETGLEYKIRAKGVINATGVFVDDLLQMDQPGAKPLVKPSQGIHLVLDHTFLAVADALMIPKTEDGRVLFAVPWHDKLVLGTTDTPVESHSIEPVALDEEIDFILRTSAQYFSRAPRRSDVLSVFAGLRPLSAPRQGSSTTKEISRSHKLIVSASGLVSITGGKWTTYRRMAENTVDLAIKTFGLEKRSCITQALSIHGSDAGVDRGDHLYVYGTDRQAVLNLQKEDPSMSKILHKALPYTAAEVIWAVRHEMARTLEDVLARRLRALFLDAAAAIEMAPFVASLIAAELHYSSEWQKEQVDGFEKMAANYLLHPGLAKNA